MGFAREPIWDRNRNMVGMRISFHEALDDLAAGERSSLWSSTAKASAAQGIPSQRGALIWSLDARLWSQACEMSKNHGDSFAQWCRHLRGHGIQISTPPLNDISQPLGESTELALALGNNSVSLHLDGITLDKASISLASKCAGIFLDATSMDHELCCNLFHKFISAGKSAILTRLASPTGLKHFSGLGVAPYMGKALWNPKIAALGTKIEPSAQKALQALCLACAGAEAADIDEVFQTDPALAYKLIALVNSAGLSRADEKIGSVKQALLFLGRDRLAQWLSALVLRAAHAKPEASALRWSLAARAKLCEALAKASPEPEIAGEAFVCGIVSGLDALLGQSREMVMEACPLPAKLVDALENEQGRLGAILSLALACEAADGLGLFERALAEDAGVPLGALDAARSEAFDWATAYA